MIDVMDQVELRRTLTLWPAVGLAVTMVVGSGVLVLPGIAYAERRADAVWSWVAAAVVCVPLLRVIAVLGAKYPSAGGIAGFIRPSLGTRAGHVCEWLLLASIPGGAGLALVAGHLVSDVASQRWLVEPVAIGFLVIATGIALRGIEFAGAVVRVMAATFVVVLSVIVIGGLVEGGDGLGAASITGVGHGIAGIGTVFFAFVGWELMAFLGGEFVDPQRDFPRMIAVSFGVVVGLYVALALSVQFVLAPSDPQLETSPIAAVAELVFGGIGRAIVTVVGLVIVTANVNGVVLAFSRLVLAMAQGGGLPRRLGVVSERGVPRRAVIATACTFAACIVPVRLGVLTQGTLFELAGSAFFAGFVIASIAYCAEADRRSERVFGYLTSSVAIAALSTFGWVALSPIGVVIVAAGATSRRATHSVG